MSDTWTIDGEWLRTDNADVVWTIAKVIDPQLFVEWVASDQSIFEVNKPSVLLALTPQEGQAWFKIDPTFSDNSTPIYLLYYPKQIEGRIGDIYVAVNALTIGRTCGQIRELWEWANNETS